MENIIELFNPNDRPFGGLSNNAYHPMKIDGKNYDTVTNYIYSNMLTTPMIRSVVQHAKIKGTGGENQELMSAIDYLIQPGPKVSSDFSEQRVDNETMIHIVAANTDYTVGDIRTWYPRKLWEEYKSAKVKEDLKLAGGPEAIDIWAEYAKSGKLKETEKELEKRREFQILISNTVRKPFDSINLPQLKQQLIEEANRNQSSIYQLYNQGKQKELYNTVSESIHKGYEVRFENPDLQNLLLATGNAPIQYESHDPFLGIGSDGRGNNMVGISLMQIRHSLRIQASEKQRDDITQKKYEKIYDIYLAYLILKREMLDNKSHLVDYLGLRPKEIITKYGLENLKQGIPTKETVIQLYKYGKVPPYVMHELYTPGTLAINVRKTGIRNLRKQLLFDKDGIIFNSYLEYIVEKNYGDEIDREAEKRLEEHSRSKMSKTSVGQIKNEIIEQIIARQKSDLPADEKDKIKDRVIDLFKLGMMSASLSDRIDADIEKLQIPTEEEVEEAEIAEIPAIPPAKEEEIAEEISSLPSSRSSDGSPVTKMMKNIFKEDKMKRSEIVDMIVSIKGGHKADYNDWSTDEIKQRLEALELEKWGEKEKEGTHVDSNIVYVQPTGKPIAIFRNEGENHPDIIPFNPESYTGMLMIDSRYYPTIQHYMIAKLISTTGTKKQVDSYGSVLFEKGIGISEAHKKILLDPNGSSKKPEDFLTIRLSGEVYDKEEADTNILLLSMFTARGLNTKFEDRSLQDLLILTGDAEIRWNSPQNLYLGAGNKEYPGKNYIGVTMMDIREKLKQTRIEEEEVDVEVEDIENFIKKDPFIMAWVKMRVQDMCGVVYKLQQYLKLKDGIDIDLNEEELMLKLVRFVLDSVYQPCSTLINLSQKVTYRVPSFFIHMVNKCKGMSSGIAPLTTIDNKGKISYNKEIKDKKSEVDKRVGQLDSEFWGGIRIEHTVSESREFDDHQRKEWADFWKDLNSSESSKAEKDEALKDFKTQQKQEYNDFWGIETGKKSRDEISRHEHQISEIKKEFSTYLRKAESVQKHFYLVSTSISQIYWERIATMVSALIRNVNPATGANIRDVLVKAEMLNSEKANCVRIIPNEQDNCIVSALMNLLSGISAFKEEFSGNLELDEDDVKIAGSIILNTNFIPTKVNVDIPYSEEEEDEEDFDVSPSGSFPLDRDDDVDDESDGEDDYGEVDDYGKNPYFAFKWGVKSSKKLDGKGRDRIGSNGDLAKVEQQVLLISTENSKTIAIEVMKMVREIKKSNLSAKIKQNRINFFASIR